MPRKLVGAIVKPTGLLLSKPLQHCLKSKRLIGNFLAAFLSPLMGGSIAFNLPIDDPNLKLLITALISASVVTGLVLSRELQK